MLNAFFAIQGNLRLTLTQTIEANVGGNLIQPTANNCWIVDGFAEAVRTEKCFLGEVFRFGTIVHEMQNVSVDTIAMSLEERSRVESVCSDLHTLILPLSAWAWCDAHHCRPWRTACSILYNTAERLDAAQWMSTSSPPTKPEARL